jgi:hypothetical protein
MILIQTAPTLATIFVVGQKLLSPSRAIDFDATINSSTKKNERAGDILHSMDFSSSRAKKMDDEIDRRLGDLTFDKERRFKLIQRNTTCGLRYVDRMTNLTVLHRAK